MDIEPAGDIVTSKHPVFHVTKVSKYLAMALFVFLPFVGGYIGYVYSPEKVVVVSTLVKAPEEKRENQIVTNEEQYVPALSIENQYVIDEKGVNCLVDIDGRLQKNVIHEVDPKTFRVLNDKYVKDRNGVYFVNCPRIDEVFVTHYKVSDVASFMAVPNQMEDSHYIFLDKDFVYIALPQSYDVEKHTEIDRSTFVPLGYGKENSSEGLEGTTVTWKNYYFKDRSNVYVIDSGHLKKLDIAVDVFDIKEYEATH